MLRRSVAALLVLGCLAVAGRVALPFMAKRLIRTDHLAQADIIVVLGSFQLERTLEAGTLFREGWSRKILLMRPPDIGNAGTLSELHIKVPLWIDIQRSVLSQMSVPAPSMIEASRTEDTTRREAEFIAGYAREHHFSRVIVVTSAYHTGRAGRMLRTAANGSFQIVMRRDRYQTIDPDHWWRHAGDRTDVVAEYMKTVYAFVAPYVEDDA